MNFCACCAMCARSCDANWNGAVRGVGTNVMLCDLAAHIAVMITRFHCPNDARLGNNIADERFEKTTVFLLFCRPKRSCN